MLIILFTILDLEGWQHVMAKRQYEEVEAGPQSTNRFIQKPTIPTTVVTGATTAPAKVQPNLTGKRKPVEVNQDSAGGSPVGDPTPVDFASLTNQELSNMANSGFAGGWTGPGSITSSIASTLGFGLVTAIGRGANMYGASKEEEKRAADRAFEQKVINDPEVRQEENARLRNFYTDPTQWNKNNISPRQAKEAQQMLTLGRSLDADSPEGYDDSEDSTTMGDTPDSESGTY